MEQKDFILREIEKIGAMIAGLIGKMIAIKEKGFIQEDELTALNEEFKENTQLDLDRILDVHDDDLDQLLSTELGFDEHNIELLADLFSAIAPLQKLNREVFIRKAIVLYEFANKKSKTYSLERAEKVRQLNNLILDQL